MEEDDPPRTYLYETLTPLALSSPTSTTAVTRTNSPLPPPSPENLEPYSVYRNEISLSELHTESFEASAQDFFSLDVGDDDVEPEPVVAATKEAEPKTPANESYQGLERVLFKGSGKFKSPMLQLHKEIVDFCDFLSPTPEEQASRNAAVLSVFCAIKYIWPNCKVEVFGSFRTGLYLPTSDIDVVILESDIKSPQLGLQALSRALSQKGIAKKIQVIGKARVPIIKFVERKSGVAFDVSFDAENGPKAADFIKDAIVKWPPLRPLCLILKVFLQQRELNEVYSGGIGSYALLTMLIAMLRNVRESRTSPEHNLGMLLVQFFDIYGRKLNTSGVGISCRGEGTFFPKSSKGFLNKGRPSLLAIEDPQLPDNDIGKNSFNYFQIKSAFAMAFSTLTNQRIIAALGPDRSILGTIIRPDAILLERKGGHNGDVTFKSLLPGAGEPLEPNYGDQQEILCNWQMDDEEEPLPRGSGILRTPSEPSVGKKRKSDSKANSAKNKGKEIKGPRTPGLVENGTKSDKVIKKQRKRGHYSASPLKRR